MRALFAIALLYTIVCCSKAPQNIHVNDNSEHYYSGNLFDALNLQYTSKHSNLSEFCDGITRDQKYDVAKAIKSHETQIEAYSQLVLSKIAEIDRLKMGRFTVTIEKQAKQYENVWAANDSFDWDHIFHVYAWARKTNLDQDWYYLNSLVRRIISDDSNRIVHWENYSLQHDDEANIRAIKKIVDECVASQCKKIEVSDEMLKWLHSREYFKWSIDHLSGNDYDKNLKEFQWRINFELEVYVTKVNPLIKVEDGDTLIVPYQEDLIAPEQAIFEQQTADTWSKYGMKVKIKWLPIQGIPIKALELGARAHFNWSKDDKMSFNISPVVAGKTLAHEFGHSLGFQDMYYTTFDFEHCRYTQEINRAEIMSDSRDGTVTEADIATLSKLYNLTLKQ